MTIGTLVRLLCTTVAMADIVNSGVCVRVISGEACVVSVDVCALVVEVGGILSSVEERSMGANTLSLDLMSVRGDADLEAGDKCPTVGFYFGMDTVEGCGCLWVCGCVGTAPREEGVRNGGGVPRQFDSVIREPWIEQ